MSRFNIAVVQPHFNPPPDDGRNVDAAVCWIGRAAAEGAEFVCFPESYPGPWRMPAAYDRSARLAEAAHRFGVHVVFGTMEPIEKTPFCATKQGLLSQWQRPELYDRICPPARRAAAE